MKKKSYLSLCFLPLVLMIVALLPACKKNNDGGNGAPPVIAAIKSYVASPGDTVLHAAVAKGQWVVITGQNLKGATQILFDGVPASFNPALFASNSAVVQIPSIQFSAIDTTKLYTVKYVTSGGSTTFSFKLGPAAPTVTAISNVFAAPGDSVHLYGANLVLIQRFVYGGTPITSFKSSLDGSSLGFLMPAATPTDQILVVTKSGTANVKIVATPTITSISNENASQGDSVFVYGTYLKNVQSLSFAGTSITSFKQTTDGSSLRFVLPALTKSGPVSVTTKFGAATTVYNVHTATYLQDGVIENMEGGWSFNGMGGWWGAGNGGINKAANDPFGWLTHTTDFDGASGTNNSIFISLNTGVLKSGDGQWYGGSGMDLSSNQWIPSANLADTADHWALKFEVSVGKDWKDGSLVISTDVGGYIYRWEPWKAGTAYKTKGWITLTIPLSSFRASDPALGDGMGDSLTKLASLVGPSGKTGAYFYLHNYSTKATTGGFYGAFDNIRIVKIK